MSLDFEQLSGVIREMAQQARMREDTRRDVLGEALTFMEEKAGDWEGLKAYHKRIETDVLSGLGSRPFRGSARPLSYDKHGLTSRFAYEEGHLPERATLVAVDGSQIVPDRHAPFVYYLINIGGIVYHHGSGRAPETISIPQLSFPEADDLDDQFFSSYASVTVKRDLEEMGALADVGCGRVGDVPLLAVMDQRLLYVPTGDVSAAFKQKTIDQWQAEMERFEACGAWLVGYVDNPLKSAVLQMLYGLHPSYDWEQPSDLGTWTGLTDVDLFRQILQAGERSKLFVDVSFANRRFQQGNRVCFFYMNTGQGEASNIARVDVPYWLAQRPRAIASIHALLYDQCQILGSYPYIITRADEMAVVQRRDQEELEFRIGRMMDAAGLDAAVASSKAQTKQWARGSKQRHE